MDKYQEMQMLDYQVKQLQKVLESIDTQLSDINVTVEALNGFKNLKNNDEVLFPIANGIFAKGKLSDNTSLKINIGSNIVVDKNIPDTIKMMGDQSSEMEKYKSEIIEQLQKTVDKLNELQG